MQFLNKFQIDHIISNSKGCFWRTKLSNTITGKNNLQQMNTVLLYRFQWRGRQGLPLLLSDLVAICTCLAERDTHVQNWCLLLMHYWPVRIHWSNKDRTGSSSANTPCLLSRVKLFDFSFPNHEANKQYQKCCWCQIFQTFLEQFTHVVLFHLSCQQKINCESTMEDLQ